MVQYKVNLKFKENGKSFNELIINALKIELEKRANKSCNYWKLEVPVESVHPSKSQRNMNDEGE